MDCDIAECENTAVARIESAPTENTGWVGVHVCGSCATGVPGRCTLGPVVEDASPPTSDLRNQR